MTKSVTERDMVPWDLGDAILGLVWRKIGIWCVFEIFDFGRSGEVRRIAVRSVILLIGRPFFGFAQNSISASSTLH